MASDLLFFTQPQRGSNPCLHLEREGGSPLQAAEQGVGRTSAGTCGPSTHLRPKVR